MHGLCGPGSVSVGTWLPSVGRGSPANPRPGNRSTETDSSLSRVIQGGHWNLGCLRKRVTKFLSGSMPKDSCDKTSAMCMARGNAGRGSQINHRDTSSLAPENSSRGQGKRGNPGGAGRALSMKPSYLLGPNPQMHPQRRPVGPLVLLGELGVHSGQCHLSHSE